MLPNCYLLPGKSFTTKTVECSSLKVLNLYNILEFFFNFFISINVKYNIFSIFYFNIFPRYSIFWSPVTMLCAKMLDLMLLKTFSCIVTGSGESFGRCA